MSALNAYPPKQLPASPGAGAMVTNVGLFVARKMVEHKDVKRKDVRAIGFFLG
jgi:hypothetical protein